MGTDLRGRRGQSVVELALLLPFLIWICMGIVDFGRVFYSDNIAINAARSGARVAADSSKTDTQVQTAITTDIASRLSVQSVAINPVAPRTPGSYVTITVTYRFRPITPLIASVIGNPRIVSRSAQMMVVY